MLILMISKSFNSTHTNSVHMVLESIIYHFTAFVLRCTKKKYAMTPLSMCKKCEFSMQRFANKFGICVRYLFANLILFYEHHVQLSAYRFRVFLNHLELFIMKRNMLWNILYAMHFVVHPVKPSKKSNFSKFKMWFYCASFHLPKWMNGNAHTFHKILFVRQTEIDHVKAACNAHGTGSSS